MMNFTNCVLAQSNSNYTYEYNKLKFDSNDFHLILFKYSSKKNGYSEGSILSIYKKDFQNNYVKEKLSLSISKYSLKLLDDKAFDYILEYSISSLIVIFDDLNNLSLVNQVESLLKSINKKNRGLLFNYKADIKDKNTKMLMNVMKISNNNFPKVIILEGISDEVNKFILNDKINLNSLTTFINDYKNSRLSTFIGSDPVPNDKKNKFGVLNLVGKNFKENVLDQQGKDILILFCSLSHKDCINVEDRLNKLSQRFKDSEIEFGHIDPITNEIDSFHVKSIPTFVLFLDKNNTKQLGKETKKYKGNYTIEDLSNFIKVNSKKRIVENKLLDEMESHSDKSTINIEKKRLEDEELALGEFFNQDNFENDNDELSNLLEGFNFEDNIESHKEDKKTSKEENIKTDL